MPQGRTISASNSLCPAALQPECRGGRALALFAMTSIPGARSGTIPNAVVFSHTQSFRRRLRRQAATSWLRFTLFLTLPSKLLKAFVRARPSQVRTPRPRLAPTVWNIEPNRCVCGASWEQPTTQASHVASCLHLRLYATHRAGCRCSRDTEWSKICCMRSKPARTRLLSSAWRLHSGWWATRMQKSELHLVAEYCVFCTMSTVHIDSTEGCLSPLGIT